MERRPGPPPDRDDGAEVALSVESAISALDQLGVFVAALEGQDLRIAAYSALARRVLQPTVGGLGQPMRGSPWWRGTGMEERILDVFETGEPWVARARPAGPAPSRGDLTAGRYDFVYRPWYAADGSIRGVLVLTNDVADHVSRRHEADDASLRAEYELRSNRDEMMTLQAAMLPDHVPVLPGLQIGARYLVAGSGAMAGGDWFSAIPLPAGRVAVVIGDVVGHGVPAAAAMGQLRSVLEERLRTGDDLATALAAVDAFAAHLPAAQATTVCAAVLDPGNGALEYCTAGHPPPLVIDGPRWTYLGSTGAGPLCSGRPHAVSRAQVPPGGMLVLYSDGVLKRPDRTWPQSSVEFAELATNARIQVPVRVAAPARVVELVCAQLLDELIETGVEDDITVLVARRVAPVPPLLVQIRDGATAVATAVEEVDRWLASLGASDRDRDDLRLAIAEVVTNSVEHGPTGDSSIGVRVEARLDDTGTVRLLVVDDGAWVEPGAPPEAGPPSGDRRPRGLGLPLAGQLVDGLTIDHDDDGTRVTLSRALTRPAPIVSIDSAPLSHAGSPPAEELTTFLRPGRTDTMMVFGPVTIATAAQLRNALDIESRASTQPLTVNLDGVTHLASAGVRVLQEVRRRAGERHSRLTLRAAPGTPAHHVLSVAGELSADPPVDPPEPYGPGG